MKKQNQSLILDCDTGEDDALAILLAVKNKLPLKYIVSSFGNTSIKNSTQNSSRLLSLSENTTSKVIKGSKQPLSPHPIEKDHSAGSFVGKNGICNTRLKKSNYDNIILSQNDADFLERMRAILEKETPVTYIITGPTTNFAKLCTALGPSIKKYVKELYIMGGAIYTPGNSGPKDAKTGKQAAEFNFYCDAKATDIVLHCGIPLRLITWDITSKATLPFSKVVKLKSSSAVGNFTIRLIKNFFTFYGLGHDRNFEFNDPLTVLAYMGYGTYKKEKIKIIKTGNEYGKSILDPNGTEVAYFMMSEKERQEGIKKILGDLDVTF